jgi:hypothetical protein
MLDRASIESLARSPEKNAPMLNVALAEEGLADVLLTLARSPALGPEALAILGERIAAEGAAVGRDPQTPEGEEPASIAPELDRLLIVHPRSPDTLRDAVLARHEDEAFFVLAAAVHPWATLAAMTRAVDWPSASPVHDRLWLSLLDGRAVPPLTLEEWAQDPSPLRREAAARIAAEGALLAVLARDPHRQVRRALASNRAAQGERARLAADDAAPEVRARAAGALSPAHEPGEGGASLVSSARFAAALRAMATHGVLAPDVARALSSNAAELDDEGARIAAQVLPRAELLGLLEQVLDRGIEGPLSTSLAAGLALRPRLPHDLADGDEDAADAEHTELVYDAVKALSRTTTAESRLTGKARLSAWVGEGLGRCEAVDRARMLHDLARRPVGGERMILARSLACRPTMLGELCRGADEVDDLPPALLELGWEDPSIPDARLLAMAARIARPRKRAEDLPEDEVDFDPTRRALPLLERVVLLTIARANVSPRAALAVVAMDARRVRYVLAAMPQWKGRLTGPGRGAGAGLEDRALDRAGDERARGLRGARRGSPHRRRGGAADLHRPARPRRRDHPGDGRRGARGARGRGRGAAAAGVGREEPHHPGAGALAVAAARAPRSRARADAGGKLHRQPGHGQGRDVARRGRRAFADRAAPAGPPGDDAPAVAARPGHTGQRHRPRLPRHRRDARRAPGLALLVGEAERFTRRISRWPHARRGTSCGERERA